jgi:AcrR family transcriptional regulator
MRAKISPSTPVVRGRPRSERAKRAVLAAVRELVEKGGYSSSTIDAVAARSGVAKTTIYRWWPNRASLLVELLVEVAGEAAPPPTVGVDPLQALHTELRLVAEASEALPGRLLISLLGEAEHDPDIRTALVHGLFNPRRNATAATIRHAQLAGALRRDVSPYMAVDLLYGPLFYRKFIRNEAATKDFVTLVFQHFLTGLKPPRGSSKRARRTSSVTARRRKRDQQG